MIQEPLDTRVQRLQEQAEALRGLGDDHPSYHKILDQTLAELGATVAEVQSADAELRRLVAELETAYDVAEAERRRYQDLFESAPDGYLVTDANGIIRDANRAASELLGIALPQLQRSPLVELVAPRYRRTFRAKLARLQREEQVGEWELRLQPPGHEPFEAAITVATIRDRAGQTTGLRWLLRDVSERKRMQDTLRLLARVSTHLARSVDAEKALPDIARLAVPRLGDWCIVQIVEDGRLTSVAAAADEPGVAAHVQAQSDRIAAELRGPGNALDRALSTREAQLVAEVAGRNVAGVAARSLVVAPLVARGQVLGALTIATRSARRYAPADLHLARDLARQIALAVDNARLLREARAARSEAERREQQLVEFVRMMAHDVQQPLTAAHWHLQIMRRALEHGKLDGVQASQEAIEIATTRLDAMIRDLVESARIEVDQLSLDRETLDLGSFVGGVIRRLVTGPHADRVRLAAREGLLVSADPNRLERIVGNLLTNALKYSHPGTPIDVAVGIDPPARPGEALVAVADRGIEISPNDLPRLFERGFRSPQAASKAEGLGLGLYITRLLVEAHGGRIWAESLPSSETTFYVALPLAEPS